MGVALIAWGRFFDHQGRRVTVPAPSTEPGAPWLLDFLATEASALSRVGFTALQLPPTSKAQGGAAPGTDGYGVYDPRDLGSKNQQGSVPTRYGPKRSLTRLVGVAHACDMDVYLDIVMHQRIGENGGPGVFEYLGADGKSLDGRGKTSPGWFRGVPPLNLPDDDVPSPFFDFQFGSELSYQHCVPHRVTTDDALDFGEWLFRTTDADGARFDDVKGTWPPFVAEFMRHGTMASKFFYSEYFDGNPALLSAWALQPPLSGRSLVEDFPLHWAFRSACDGGDARALDGAGFAASEPTLACTFVENPDTDTSPGQQIISNKLLAYAFLLSIEGYPFVYGRDYFPSSVWPGAYGLKPWIDNLIWIHEHLAAGPTVNRFLDGAVIVLNRVGAPGLLTAINFDGSSARTVTCQTAFGQNVPLHDYTGRHPDIRTDGQGRASFTIPSNAFGRGQSYLCFSRTGVQTAARGQRRTTQSIFGAADLDVAPLSNLRVACGQFVAQAGSTMALRMLIDKSAWATNSTVHVEVLDSTAATVLQGTGDRHADLELSGTATRAGEHTVFVRGENLPAPGSPFELRVSYLSVQQV